MKILVTGADGFIELHTCLKLINQALEEFIKWYKKYLNED